MNYEEAKAKRDELEAAHKAASEALSRFPTGPLGLTPDAVKSSPEWRQAHASYWKAHHALADFNGTFTKTFKKEIREERKNRFR